MLVWGQKLSVHLVEGTGEVSGDEKLLRYLYEHKHLTPFEMCGLTIEVQAPIFVFREWHRHRTQSYNELSARYTELPNLFYIPDNERLMAAKQSKKNKQGSEDGFTEVDAGIVQGELKHTYGLCRDLYEHLLAKGVAREIARLVIPVAQYSRMRASANLRNWLAFLTLRMDPAAQYEIRAYANVVGDLIKQEFPRVWELFDGAK
jgi:thymidylate synthase (FAD)